MKYIHEIESFIGKEKNTYDLAFTQTEKADKVQALMNSNRITKIRVREITQNQGFCHSVTRYDRIGGKWHMRSKYIGEDEE